MSDGSDGPVMQRQEPTATLLDDEEHRSMRRGLLDLLLSELASEDERRREFAELLAPEVAELLAPKVAELLAPEVVELIPPPDGWIDGRAASRHLGISHQRLQKRAATGEIPSHQGRPGMKRFFRRSELDAWRARNGSAYGASDG